MTEASRPEPPGRHRPRLVWALRRGGGDYYDRLGLTVLGSILMTIPAATAFSAVPLLRINVGGYWASAVLLLVAFYGTALCWAMNVFLAHRIACFEDPGMDAFSAFMRKLGLAALKMATLQVVVSGIMLVDAWFFLSQRSLVPRLAGMVTSYILFLWLLTTMWQWPFLVLEDGNVFKCVKKSALVLLDNPFFTLGVFSVTITAGALLAVSMIGIPTAMGGLLSCFVVRAHREVLMKYGIIEDEPQALADAGWPGYPEPPRRLNPRQWVQADRERGSARDEDSGGLRRGRGEDGEEHQDFDKASRP